MRNSPRTTSPIAGGEAVEDPVEAGQEAVQDAIDRRGDEPAREASHGEQRQSNAPNRRGVALVGGGGFVPMPAGRQAEDRQGP